jgi:hypothetical protein
MTQTKSKWVNVHRLHKERFDQCNKVLTLIQEKEVSSETLIVFLVDLSDIFMKKKELSLCQPKKLL